MLWHNVRHNVTKSVRKRKIPLTGGKFSRRLETICKLKESQKKHKNNFEKNHKAHICVEKLHSLGIISWTLNKRRNRNLKNNSQCPALQWGLFDQSKDSVALLQCVFFLHTDVVCSMFLCPVLYVLLSHGIWNCSWMKHRLEKIGEWNTREMSMKYVWIVKTLNRRLVIRYICDKTFLELSKKLLWLFGVVGEALFLEVLGEVRWMRSENRKGWLIR